MIRKILLENPEIKKLVTEKEASFSKKGFSYIPSALDLLPKDLEKSDFSCIEGVLTLSLSSNHDFSEPIQKLSKWKKGPFQIGTHFIDAEWRSDKKWDRLKGSLPNLEGKTVLDIGSNNGYFSFRLALEKAKEVLAIDPTLHFYGQYLFLQSLFQVPNISMLPIGFEQLPLMEEMFDVILSLGVLYHHPSPIEQLKMTLKALKPGGEAFVETIGIPGEESVALSPKDRYALMKNVYFLPTLSCFQNWMERAGFSDIQVIAKEWDKEEEQRSTEFSSGPAYLGTLNSRDFALTIEGYPAPRRFILKGSR